MTAEPFESRLRRLRRETGRGGPQGEPGETGENVAAGNTDGVGATDPGTVATSSTEPALRDRLARREQRFVNDRRTSALPAREPIAEVSSLAAATSLGLPDDLSPPRPNGDGLVARITDLDPAYRHGDWQLDEIAHSDARTIELLAADPSLACTDLSQAVFLDTETSGLSGGAGTYVFLVGLGSFDRGRFAVWQGFLADPRGERALLAEASRRIRSGALLVSFFGKSFDRHRLEDKMRFHGIDPPFAGRPHLDLYYPLRRLYGRALGDGRLRTMESALCGLERIDDLPGALAPAAWFDFLAGRAHRLEGVFRHNLEDVLSLVTLCAHLGRAACETRIDGRELAGPAEVRARGLARASTRARAWTKAVEWYGRALRRSTSPEGSGSSRAPESREMRLAYVEALRRAGEEAQAAAVCRELDSEPEDAVTARALVELASLLASDASSQDEALAMLQRAHAIAERQLAGSGRAQLEKSRARIEARLRRGRAAK